MAIDVLAIVNLVMPAAQQEGVPAKRYKTLTLPVMPRTNDQVEVVPGQFIYVTLVRFPQDANPQALFDAYGLMNEEWTVQAMQAADDALETAGFLVDPPQ
jgi:hypothetical protein